MQRSFGVDLLACQRCGGRLRLMALIEAPRAIRRMLMHLGLPTEVPPPRPSRAPPIARAPTHEFHRVRAADLPGRRHATRKSPGQTFEYTIPNIDGRPWAQIWERYHEDGMTRPDDGTDALFRF